MWYGSQGCAGGWWWGGELWANDDGDGEVKQRLNLMVTHQSAPF